MKVRLYLLCTAALFGAGPALAQQQAAAAATPEHSTGLAEVIVTAERHTANVQKTAISIAIVKSDALEKAGVNRAEDLSLLVPGLDIENGGPGAAAIYIRGVGANPFSALQDQANAFSVDGVYFNRGIGPDVTFYDIDRIEVLKGPQGTLYGRNATGGAVNVITNRPVLGRVAGDVEAEYGNYDAYKTSGAVNLPVGDDLAVRLAGNRVAHDGYSRDGSDDEDSWALRGGVMYKPVDTVSLFVSGDYGAQNGRGPSTAFRAPDPLDPKGGSWAAAPRAGPCSPQARALIASRSAANPILGLPPFGVGAQPLPGARCDGFTDNKIGGVSATLDVDLGFAKWTNIAAYRRTDQNTRWYIGPLSVSNRGGADQYTYESRLGSTTGPFQWIVGGFFFQEQQDNISYAEFNRDVPYALVGGYIHSDLPDILDRSWALFGQTTYSLTDAFRVTGGIRYTVDHKDVRNGTLGFATKENGPNDAPLLFQLVPFPVTVPAPVNNIRGTVDENKINYRVGVEYDLARANMVYANVATGFHAGGLIFGDDVGPLPTAYKPEELTAYTAGSKNRFFDNRVQLNAEFFYYDYKNLQVQVVSDVNCSSCIFTNHETQSLVITNAGKAHIYGLDLDGSALITPDDLLTVSMLLDSSEYNDFKISQLGMTVSGTGNSLQGLPTLTTTLGYQHTFRLADGGEVVLGVQSRYWSGAWLLFSDNPGSYQRDYITTNVNITYSAPGDRWYVGAFVRNLENVVAMNNNGEQFNSYQPAGGTNLYFATLNPPRTFGITAGLRF
jgi:iron complex outermembrane receptor protein